MTQTILVIGGYGKVGSTICRQLAALYPYKVIAAGRNFKKADELAKAADYKIIPKKFDVLNDTDDDILENVQLVIMCIDQENTDFLFKCISKGINYIDITAENTFFEKAANLHSIAELKQVTVLLSVGLAPGISNLLAKHTLNSLKGRTKVDLYILLGLGEKHGDAAYRWTFNNIHDSYNVSRNSNNTTIKSFSNPKRTNLEGSRMFYTFNFSDQYILSKITQAEVLTRFAFESRFLTVATGVLRKYGITKIFGNSYFQKLLLYIFKNFSVGTDVFAVKAVASHTDGTVYESTVTGNCESKITAYTTVLSVLELLKKESKPGVYHLHEIVNDIPGFLNQLKGYDPSVKIKL